MPQKLELTLQEALRLGMRLLREDALDAAEHVYRTVLAQHRDQPDALHYMGLLRHRLGRGVDGLRLMRRSIDLAPGHPWMLNNLGNVLVEQQRLDEALDAYRHCLALDPQAADAMGNLGLLYRKLGQHEEAEQACRQSVALQPERAIGWFSLARVLIERGEIHAGLLANSKAVVLAPRDQTGRYRVARALVQLGEIEAAAAIYREWLEDEPDNELVRHHLAACEGDVGSLRAPDGYIETVFDSFSVSFDAKLASLGYRAPQLIAGLLERRLPAPARQFSVVDVGCGTGLCGPLVREWAGQLAGCDLSAGMLRLADQRLVYDQLEKSELVAYLRARPEAFDVVISADTLCYFGVLAEFADAAFGALRGGGRLVFTVEALSGDGPAGYRLLHHGRYAHAASYLSDTLADAGFVVDGLEQELLRTEAGLPVPGWLVSAVRPETG